MRNEMGKIRGWSLESESVEEIWNRDQWEQLRGYGRRQSHVVIWIQNAELLMHCTCTASFCFLLSTSTFHHHSFLSFCFSLSFNKEDVIFVSCISLIQLKFIIIFIWVIIFIVCLYTLYLDIYRWWSMHVDICRFTSQLDVECAGLPN